MVPIHSQLKPARIHRAWHEISSSLKWMYHMMSGDPLYREREILLF